MLLIVTKIFRNRAFLLHTVCYYFHLPAYFFDQMMSKTNSRCPTLHSVRSLGKRTFNTDLVMSSPPWNNQSRSWLMACCIFLLSVAVWCDAGRNSRTSAVFQLNAACRDLQKQTTSECSAYYKICMKDVVQFNPIQNASYSRLVHFILFFG